MKCKYHLCEKEATETSQYCGTKCKNKWTQTEWLKRRKQKFVDYKGGKCEKCGYDKHVEALCFHHNNPNEKEFGIATNEARKKPEAEVFEEIDKCSLLCLNCHAEEHIVIRG
jgi:hypothetical protein